jgi:Mn-dependent DtxR family transcriptional regulator
MAKVVPYHTNSDEYLPKHREVYHDHDDCPDGRKILARHRENGTGNKLRCDECKKLD